MHKAPSTLSDYRKQIDEALGDEFLRRTLDTFAVAYKANREAVFKEVDERKLIKEIADAKDDACKHMEELYEQFKTNAEKLGIHVHRAADAEEANRIVVGIAKKNHVKRVIKSKSMTAEEIQLNPALEKEGIIVDETDLGEWIIQLRHEGPSHMVMPAIHLSRYQVAENFQKETGEKQEAEDVQKLVKVARVQLRRKFISADMGVSGCNFAIAENAAISTVTNEGNARMVETLPPVHVAIAGLDKLVPTPGTEKGPLGPNKCPTRVQRVVAAPGLDDADFATLEKACQEKGFLCLREGLRGYLAGIDVGLSRAVLGVAASAVLNFFRARAP